MNTKDRVWLGRATSTKDPRPFAQYIFARDGRLMASDGHRMHVVVCPDIEPGIYNKKGEQMDDGAATAPDFEFLIDREGSRKRVGVVPFIMLQARETSDRKPRSTVYDFAGVTVCAKYVDEAAKGFKNPVIEYAGPRDALIIREPGRLAIIVPMLRKT